MNEILQLPREKVSRGRPNSTSCHKRRCPQHRWGDDTSKGRRGHTCGPAWGTQNPVLFLCLLLCWVSIVKNPFGGDRCVCRFESGLHTRICPRFVLPSPSGPHRALSRAPCALLKVLTVISLHIVSILRRYPSKSPNSSHPPTFPLSSYICSLRLCLYFCFANRFNCTIFLDPTHMY